VRIATDQAEGAGVMGTRRRTRHFSRPKALVGGPFAVYTMQDGRITGRAPAFAPLLARYQHLDGPLFDLIGKLTSKPCWQLLGSSARQSRRRRHAS
jgi:hypothetical protein